ncbi:sulfotransferase [Microbacterium excoecariae]|uniref:sulfotransferase n=1 Tax=Microbacterium excoecariae TaxID=2715210 RepID=UPI00140DBD5C|nr:sulfotransferase [Microbacterium excoecariae]
MTHDWRNHEFIFVGGMHRSGTTLLADALGETQNVSAFANTGAHMNEGQFLQDVYLPGYHMGGVTRWARDDRSHLTEKDASTSDIPERLWESWSPFWNLESKYLVEKTPQNLTKTRFLQKAFPNSKYLIITRHPVTQALAVMKWSPRRAEKLGWRFDRLIEHWLIAHETFQRDSTHLRDVTLVKYENISADPNEAVANLSNGMGINLAPKKFLEYNVRRASEYAIRWNDRKLYGLFPEYGPVLSFLGSLVVSTQFSSIRRRYESRLNSFGYSFDDVH